MDFLGHVPYTEGKGLTICIRPEDVMTRGLNPDTSNLVDVEITTLDFLGSFYRTTLKVVVDSKGIEFTADMAPKGVRHLSIGVGQTLKVALPKEHIHVFLEPVTD